MDTREEAQREGDRVEEQGRDRGRTRQQFRYGWGQDEEREHRQPGPDQDAHRTGWIVRYLMLPSPGRGGRGGIPSGEIAPNDSPPKGDRGPWWGGPASPGTSPPPPPPALRGDRPTERKSWEADGSGAPTGPSQSPVQSRFEAVGGGPALARRFPLQGTGRRHPPTAHLDPARAGRGRTHGGEDGMRGTDERFRLASIFAPRLSVASPPHRLLPAGDLHAKPPPPEPGDGRRVPTDR